MHRRFSYLFVSYCLFAVLTALGLICREGLGAPLVRVGIPAGISRIGPAGEIRGVYPDLLREIARQEGWSLKFSIDSNPKLLDRLRLGKIDLLTGLDPETIAKNDLAATADPVLTAWAQVFTRTDGRAGRQVRGLPDIQGATIGLVDDDPSAFYLRDLSRQFRLSWQLLSFPELDTLCRALDEQKIEALVIPNIAAPLFVPKAYPTPVVFSPSDQYIAAAKSGNRDLMTALDHWLGLWRQDSASVYTQILSRWESRPAPADRPLITKTTGIIGGITLLVFFLFVWLFVWNRILGLQVRRRTRAAKQTAEKYKALSEKALIGIFQIDDQGRLIMVNQRMAKIFAFPDVDALLDQGTITTLFSIPEELSQIREDLSRNEAVEGRLVEFLTRDKQLVWGSLSIRQRQDDRDRTVYEGYVEDVSQHHRHSQLLRARLSISQMSGSCSTDELIRALLDKTEELTRSSASFFHLLSEDQNTLLSQTWSAGTLKTAWGTDQHEGQLPLNQEEIWAHIRAGCVQTETPEIHNHLRDPDNHPDKQTELPPGYISLARMMVIPVIRNQKVCAVLGVGNKKAPYTDADLDMAGELADTAWDILMKNRAEQEAKQTQNRFLAILNGIESTIYVADINTHEILFMNDYMKKLFKEDLTGGICWKAFRHQDRPCRHCTNRFLLDGDKNPTGIHLWEDKHPITGRWNIYHDRAIKWVDGRMARLQIATDVTRIKRMEHQQRRYEEKIRQAQKMEALGALASGIAHDFNNILFPILGYSEMLREEFTEETRQRKGLEEIVNGAQRARELVEQILTFSRQAETRVSPLKPEIIIKEVIKLMRASLPTTIRIDQSVAKGVHKIKADPTQIHQVAMNLITNAFHAMESAGGILTVRLENSSHPDSDKSGPYVLFSVKDTGTGMDPSTRAKIFEPYFTTKPEGKGTGLGLSMVYGIVKKYRGDIVVTSQPGEGSCFEIYLPAVIGQNGPAASSLEGEIAGGTERILLVDDDPQVLLLLKELLQRKGYTVVTESSSPKALERIRREPEGFDLVITDMTMPEMAGDILTLAIRDLSPHLGVIICTGFSERLTPERIKELGVRGVLFKPVSKAQLAKQVRKALDGDF